MLTLVIDIEEGFNDETNEFVLRPETLELEHSLVSLSTWESKWEKAFLDKSVEKTEEMLLDYIRCMILGPYDESTLNHISMSQVQEINNYIDSKQSATWFNEGPGPRKGATSGRVITSDLIYYWMVAMTIPFECQYWHLNRLITLIRITDLENQPKKKMTHKDNMSRHRSLNQARRAQNGGRG